MAFLGSGTERLPPSYETGANDDVPCMDKNRTLYSVLHSLSTPSLNVMEQTTKYLILNV